MYEHPEPFLPFEEKNGFDIDLSKDNTGNNTSMEDLQKMTSNVITTGKTNRTNDTTPIGDTQTRKVSSKTFRV
ncbi:MAG: hypothetical protein M3115_01090 [Thermoproteota archaeon]|nr:hypothetical protein [Thermoproteota archaeon]